jgi:iron(III) transport system substrate-binding protein
LKRRLLIFALALSWLTGCNSKNERTVVVYTSQDQEYAEPILNRFTKQSGIQVRAVYDSEAVKTVGLVNRLLAEKNQPQCDVFWNNEELRTRLLASRNIFAGASDWVAVGYRERQIVFNTNLLGTARVPKTLLSLTNETWKGKLAIAYPFFGTTATHFLVLRQKWGTAAWEKWCRALAANSPLLVDGNSVVVKLVARGEAQIGLTDSDDIIAGQRDGLHVAALALAENDRLQIPNTIGLIRGAPHPSEGQQLQRYLSGQQVLATLLSSGALVSTSPPKQSGEIPWSKVLDDLEPATKILKEIFLR